MNSVKSSSAIIDAAGFETLEIISQASAFNEWMYRHIQPYLKGSILEIGSGIGNISDFVVRDGYHVTLSDYNPAYCSILTEKYRSRKNVQEIFTLDVQDPGFFSTYYHLHERYDTIYLLNVIEHVPDDAKVVEYCGYMLKPNGRLILLAPAFRFLYSRLDSELGHYRRYRIHDFRKLLLQNNYAMVHLQYFNFLGFLGWLLFGKIAGRKQLAAGEFSIFNKLIPLARLLDKLAGNKAGLSVIAIGDKNR